MNDNFDTLDFARVFRHEMAAICDSRRWRRIEALGRLGAEGDYSNTSRQWALNASRQEAELAASTAKIAFRLRRLTKAFEGPQSNSEKLAKALGRIAKALPESDPDSLVGGLASRRRLQEFARTLQQKLLQETHPRMQRAEIIREVLALLRRAFIIRERDSAPAGEMDKLNLAVAEAAVAAKRAASAERIVQYQALVIDAGAKVHTTSEKLVKAQAAVLLFKQDDPTTYEAFASVAKVATAIADVCWKAKEIASFRLVDPYPLFSQTEVLRLRYFGDTIAVAKPILTAFHALLSAIDLASLNKVRIGEAVRLLIGFGIAAHAPVADAAKREKFHSDLELHAAVPQTLKGEVLSLLSDLPGKLKIPDLIGDDIFSTNLLEKAKEELSPLYKTALLLLPGAIAASRRYANPTTGEFDFEASPAVDFSDIKQFATSAVEELGKRATRVAEWAWAVETATAQAVGEATAVLAKKIIVHAESPEAEDHDSGLSGITGSDIEQLRTQALERGMFGLAFSGGGIRSATLGLGVLQGLGHLKLLRFVDYFSTVSGGGYIGGWLAGWIHREQSLLNVEKQLDPHRLHQGHAQRVVKTREDAPSSSINPAYKVPKVIDDEPEPIQHLRAYSRYLAPKLFSADTWTLGAIYLRNLIVNLVSLAPWIFVVILLSRLLLWMFTLNEEFAGGAISLLFAVLFGLSGLGVAAWAYQQRARLHEAEKDPLMHPDGADRMGASTGIWVIAGTVVLAISTLWFFSYSPPMVDNVERHRSPLGEDMRGALRHPFYDYLNNQSSVKGLPNIVKFTVGCGLATLLVSLIGALLRSLWYRKFRRDLLGALLLGDVILGLGLGLFLFLADYLVIKPAGTDAAAVVTFGIPAVLLAVVLADYFEMLFVGSSLNESEREWRSRIGAFLFMIGLAWLAFYLTTLYLPAAIQRLLDDKAYRKVWLSSLAAAWAAFSTLTAWVGKRLQSKSNAGWSIPWMKLVLWIGPPIFLIGLLTFSAMLTFLISPAGEDRYLDIACTSTPWAGCELLFYFALGLFFMVLWVNCIKVNVFSLHMMYANRLIRCYLGASRRKQNWNNRVAGPVLNRRGESRWLWGPGTRGGPTNAQMSPSVRTKTIARREPTFTDFDPSDDMRLTQLRLVAPIPAPAAPAGGLAHVTANAGYRGPYPLFNTALNLVGSADLAIQDRRAAAFVLTPDFCGGSNCGYARTRGHALTLGRAITISGAAVDPNMGVIYTPQLTALMTILNTRLGWWLQNPLRWQEDWRGEGPGPDPLVIWELLGQTNETSRYVHLSDGGHFENLGVYELIRRRCRYIIVTDADTDRYPATVNLANLLRLARTDFGIDIQIETQQLTEGPDGRTKWHCAVGIIHYEDVDPNAVSGVLVYLNSSLTGDESPDILQYAHANPPFPHQTTLDQFFDEGQFESYRALGYHIATEVLGEAAQTMNRACCDARLAQKEVRDFFTAVRKQWFPAPATAEQQFIPSAMLHVSVNRQLRDDVFQRLRQELYPETRDGNPAHAPQVSYHPGALPTASTELQMISELFKAMEMVWFGLKLDDNHAHPLNRGWMNLFRRWTSSPTVHAHWPFLRGELGQEFVRFCEQALNMIPVQVLPEALDRHSIPGHLSEIREMDLEFCEEWAGEQDHLHWLTTGRYLIDAVVGALALEKSENLGMPMVWRLAMSDGHGGSMQRACGLACAGPAFLGSGRNLEFLIWLRGPYRDLGIGRLAMPTILNQIKATLKQAVQAAQPFRLVCYYPNNQVNRADRLAKAQWLNFFFDLGFRSAPPDDPAALPGTVAVVLEIS